MGPAFKEREGMGRGWDGKKKGKGRGKEGRGREGKKSRREEGMTGEGEEWKSREERKGEGKGRAAHILPRDASAERGYEIVCRPPSVCLSVYL